MTPHAIIVKLFSCPIAGRIQKAKNLAQRQRIDWQLVLDAMTPEQRAQVEAQGA